MNIKNFQSLLKDKKKERLERKKANKAKIKRRSTGDSF